MKPSHPVDYERAAKAMAAAERMPSDPDVLERQQVEAAAHVDAVRAKVLKELGRVPSPQEVE